MARSPVLSEAVDADRLEIEITKAKPTGSRLRGDRGINFPDSDIRLPGITALDKTNLKFAIERADAVSLSFVRRPADIIQLHEEMDRLGNSEHGLIIKIETKKGIQQFAEVVANGDAALPGCGNDCSRRPGGRMWLGATGRITGRDIVVLRGGTGTCYLGDPGVGR